MSKQPPNLFNALFDWRPTDGRKSAENFLTEAFVHILRTSKPARDEWLSLVLGNKVRAQSADFQTRRSERVLNPVTLRETVVYPDLFVDIVLSDGQRHEIYSEHKWDANCNPEQLKCYLAIAARSRESARVIFVGKTHRQTREAKQHLETGATGPRCFLWEDVYQVLNHVPEKSELFIQLMDFMQMNGLSPNEPLSPARLKAFYNAWGVGDAIKRMLDGLKEEDWSLIPERCRKGDIRSAWGSHILLFETQGWQPFIAIGFLCNPFDHMVEMVDKEKGIDLMLRIAVKDAESILPDRILNSYPILKDKQRQLLACSDSALLIGDDGNNNKHSLLIVRSCLTDVIHEARTEASQLELIYKKLSTWVEILFADGSLDSALIRDKIHEAKLA